MNDFKLASLPQQIQDAHNAAAVDMMKELSGLGFSPVAAVSDHAQAGAALTSLTQSQGSVPPLFALHVGNQTVAYDLSHLADDDSGKILDTVNKFGRVLGRPDFTSSQWAQVPATDKAKIINDSLGVMNVVPDPSKIGAQIAEAKFRASTYALQPSWKQDPDVKAGLQRNINMLTAAQKDFDDHAVNMAAREAAAKAQAEQNAKGGNGNVFTGAMPDGTLVAGTPEELQAAGVKNPYKLPSADVSKMEIARQLISPGGLFDNVAADVQNLNKAGKLGVAASRWNNILTNKLGTGDQDYARLATDIGLLQTAVMQAHVGARGGNEMLEHFKQTIGDPTISDTPTLLARLGASWDYMNHKAMRIPAQKVSK